MANQEQLDILKQGVEVWNKWREEQMDIHPDLSGADLRDADLSVTNLSIADLSGADLSGADLRGATFSGANLSGANLIEANIRDATFSEADLRGATFSGADLSGVDLSGADLGGVDLSGADLGNASAGPTLFANVDLRTVKGLDTVRHYGSSSISTDTFVCSEGVIPEVFLRGAGLSDTFIDYVRSLVGKAIEHYSCFISYASIDEGFARRLYADLQSNNVRCWFALEDLKIGDKIRHRIDESIRIHDKLLLVLSVYSTASQWVEQEVATALARERKEQRTVLFPIRLDNAIMEIESDWPFLIRNTRNIGDFTRWKNHNHYQKALTRLLRDLKAEVPGRL